jgi:hypothetical protein
MGWYGTHLASPFFVVVAGHATVWTSFPFTQQRIYTVCMGYPSKVAKSLSVRFDLYIHSWYTWDLPRRMPPLPSLFACIARSRAYPRAISRPKAQTGRRCTPLGDACSAWCWHWPGSISAAMNLLRCSIQAGLAYAAWSSPALLGRSLNRTRRRVDGLSSRTTHSAL